MADHSDFLIPTIKKLKSLLCEQRLLEERLKRRVVDGCLQKDSRHDDSSSLYRRGTTGEHLMGCEIIVLANKLIIMLLGPLAGSMLPLVEVCEPSHQAR